MTTEPAGQPLQVESLRLRLGGQTLFDALALEIAGGRTLSIIGASGCGKTSLLKAIAGLLAPETGRIRLGSKWLHGLPARERNAVYLYQEPLLFPHLDVFGNIAFGLRLRGVRDTDLKPRVYAMLERLELASLARRRPQQLSGGQRQRVAFGRALIVEPALLLLDEPFSNLDPETRAAMQTLFKEVAHERGITAVFVTHDLKESLLMGDSFAVIHAGRLRMFSNREQFCADPATGVMREAAFWRLVAREQVDPDRTPPADRGTGNGSCVPRSAGFPQQPQDMAKPLHHGETHKDDEHPRP